MIKAAVKKKALALFLRGYSIRQIAQKVDISRSTLERWSTRESWVENRDAFQHEALRVSAKAVLHQDIGGLIKASDIALSELKYSFSLVEVARNRRYSSKTVRRLFRNTVEQVKIFTKLFEAQNNYLAQRKMMEDIEKASQERRKLNELKTTPSPEL
jgi:transposase